MKHTQMETAVVILNNLMVHQISLTQKALCLLLFLLLNQHQLIGIKENLIKTLPVNIVYNHLCTSLFYLF